MQSKKHSLVESLIQVGSGFIISMIMAYWVLPLFGIPQDILISFEITMIYTVTSFARQYILRRIFNKKK